MGVQHPVDDQADARAQLEQQRATAAEVCILALMLALTLAWILALTLTLDPSLDPNPNLMLTLHQH